VNDFVTTVDARFGRPGFPRSWPDVYSSSKALRRLLGKKGLQGAMSKTVDLLSKVYIFTLSRSPPPNHAWAHTPVDAHTASSET